jgi:hypothetical protein
VGRSGIPPQTAPRFDNRRVILLCLFFLFFLFFCHLLLLLSFFLLLFLPEDSIRYHATFSISSYPCKLDHAADAVRGY